ncbi:hypothetical protein, partial [Siccirubricoccus deserti]|uniref:hypothetical protein n=1 Tax=Siccirubricoccus deserti TaxID=2013562 RepID=UPI001C945668
RRSSWRSEVRVVGLSNPTLPRTTTVTAIIPAAASYTTIRDAIAPSAATVAHGLPGSMVTGTYLR